MTLSTTTDVAVCIGLVTAVLVGLGLARGKAAQVSVFREFLAVAVTNYGGGILRDWFLGVKPSFLHAYHCWLVSVGVFLAHHIFSKRLMKKAKLFLTHAEPFISGIGTAGFLQAGLIVAENRGVCAVFALFLAMLTSFGGSLIGILVFEIHPLKKLRRGRRERLWVLFCLLYYFPIYKYFGGNKANGLVLLILISLCTIAYAIMDKPVLTLGISWISIPDPCFQAQLFQKRQMRQLLNPCKGVWTARHNPIRICSRHSIFLMP